MAPEIRAELALEGVPAGAQDQIVAGFAACVHDRSAQDDPAVVPTSCQPNPVADEAVSRVLAQAGIEANAVNFAESFRHTLFYGIGMLLLVCLGFLALPKDAKLEQRVLDDEREIVTV